MQTKHIFLAILIALIWGFNFITVKISLNEITPMAFGALRFLIVLFPFIFIIKKPNVSWKKISILGMLLGFGKFALMFLGIKMGMPAGLASLVLQSQVIFNAILSYFILGQKISVQQSVGIVIALVGISVIGSTVDCDATFWGFLFLIASAALWSFSNIFLRKMQNADMLSIVIWISLVPIIPFVISSVICEDIHEVIKNLQNISPQASMAVLYTGWISTILGYTWWGKLLKNYSPNVVGIYGLLVPIFSVFFGWLLLGENLDKVHILAACLVIIGLFVNQGMWKKIINLFSGKKIRSSNSVNISKDIGS